MIHVSSWKSSVFPALITDPHHIPAPAPVYITLITELIPVKLNACLCPQGSVGGVDQKKK